MDQKLNLGLLFGGRSMEHEISILSAKNVYKYIDKDKYNISLLAVDTTGSLFLADNSFFKQEKIPTQIIKDEVEGIELQILLGQESRQFFKKNSEKLHIDVVFSTLHGPEGEGGPTQGLLDLAHIPYVGCKTLSSAICMDKDIAKKILKQSNLPVTNSVTIFKHDFVSYKNINFDFPVFVKPCRQGSSFGVSKVLNKDEYEKALKLAFKFDHKILVEEACVGRELECAILGNTNPKASVIGEVIIKEGFYSYKNKYKNNENTQLEAPAKLKPELVKKLQDLSIKAFEALNCSGMARCDFFLSEKNEIYINEINTLPGFTDISQYPILWELSGVKRKNLIDELIRLGLEDL